VSHALAAHLPSSLVQRGLLSRRALLMGLGLAVLLVVATAARLTALRDVPRLTDETDEVMRGFAIARGEILPLTNVDAYIGPLWNYLLAAGFLVFGPSAAVPRALTVLVGLLTVAATLWLGWELARRLGLSEHREIVAGGAAFLLATSSFHAVVSSRIGWSHALTPLFMTLALALLLRWERTASARSLAFGGLTYGLAVHTHPTALAVAPGLLAWALLHASRLARRRAAYAGLGLAIAVNLPLLVFNLGTGLGSASAAAQVRVAYSGGQALTPDLYLQNLSALLGSVPLLLAGQIGERRGAWVDSAGIAGGAFVVFAAIGIAMAVRDRVWLPGLTMCSAILILPVFNGKYEPLFNGRYLAPLLPLAFALVVVAVVEIVSRLGQHQWTGRAASATVLVALAIPSVFALRAYLDAAMRDGPNNAELYQALRLVEGVQTNRPILFDATISGMRASTSRDGVGVLEYLLMLDGHQKVRRLTPRAVESVIRRGDADVVIVSPQLASQLIRDGRAAPLPGEEAARRRRHAGFALLRMVGSP